MKTTQKANVRFLSSFLATLALFSIGIPLSGCQSELNSSDSNPDALNDPASNSPPPASAALADGWTQVLIQANYAKTKVDAFAHWNTNRNACGKDADGALELEVWNRLVTAVNHAVTHPLLAEPRCQPKDQNSENASKMDGTAQVTHTQGKFTLIEVRDTGEICSFVKDEAYSKQLIQAITDIVLIADKEDCPFGWGGSN